MSAHNLPTANDIYSWSEDVKVVTDISSVDTVDAIVSRTLRYADALDTCGCRIYGEYLVEEETPFLCSKGNLGITSSCDCCGITFKT